MSESEKLPREPMTPEPRDPHDERRASPHALAVGGDDDEPQICRGLD